MSAQVRGGLPAVLLAFVIVAGSLVPILDSSPVVSAESLPSWTKLFRMHEGFNTNSTDYDWLNTSGLQNVGYVDYDGDGNLGITIKKNLPSQRWRHFWALDPPVNQDVHIQGDIGAHVWAASLDNESGYSMTVRVSDMAPGQWGNPESWVSIGEATVAIQGPVYTLFKTYDFTIAAVDYVLLDGHSLVMTIFRGDSKPSGAILVLYDGSFDSYITVPTQDFVEVADAWAENSAGQVGGTFSDTESITVFANVSDPFGSYDIVGVTLVVWNDTDGSMAVPFTPMALSEPDPGPEPFWAVFMLEIGRLPGGSFSVNVSGRDPSGCPTWSNFSISIVSVDHFLVLAPSTVTAGVGFEMSVTALDASDVAVPDWRGTVSLDAFEADMVTAASGTFSVPSVEFTGMEGGVVTISNQTYAFGDDFSLGQETIVIRAQADLHIGWSDQMAVYCGPVMSVEILWSDPDSVESGDTEALTAEARDANGFVNVSWTPVWSVIGDMGTVEPSGFSAVFTATSAGTGYIMCEDSGTGVNATVYVEVVAGSLYRIEVTPPGPLTVREGQSISLSAEGYDVGDNPVSMSSPTWLTDTSGTISGSGSSVTYIAGFIPETGTITVSVGAISASVDVTVTTALNGPWLSTIPTQIVNEDSTWTLSLSSYWNHVNGTSSLRWYAEGVDTSLYLVTHDPDSAALVKFITQPDEFGTDTFRLWVRDPDGFSAFQDVTVSIQPVNDLPSFVHAPPTEFYVKFDTPYSFDFDYYVWDVDNEKEDLSMMSSSSDWGSIVFEDLISSFLFVEKDGRVSYFETMKLTVTDAPSGTPADSTNSAYLSIVVWVTEDTPPSMNGDIPDIDFLKEGDMHVPVFDLDDYFYDVDEDFLVYESGFLNIEVEINDTTHQVFMSAPYEWSGVTDGTFTAVDPVGAFMTDTVTVTVAPVNDAPTVSKPDDLHVHYEVAYTLDAALYVYDPDHSFAELDFTFSTPYVSYSDQEIIITFPADLSGGPYTDAYMVEVNMTVEDPEGASGWSEFLVTVSDNYPPALSDPVPYPDIMSFAEDTYLNASIDLDLLFYDLDDASLQYASESVDGEGNVLVTIHEDSTVDFTAKANWSGYEVVQFRAFDEHHAWISWRVTVVVTPVNDAPVVLPIDDLRLYGWPRNFQMFIIQYIKDIETPFTELLIVATPEDYVSAAGQYLYVTMPEDLDEVPVTIYVVDAEGAQSNSVTFTISLGRTTSDIIGYPYSLPLVLLAAAVAGYFIASRIPKPYSLENLFLIHNDGRLVAHVTRQENTSIDKDVVSAMFTAVQEFVRDSFQAGEVGLKKLEIGDKNVMIEKGKSVYLAMIYTGWPPKEVFSSITMLLSDIEERFGERISHWNGTMKAVKGVEGMLHSFMSNRFKAGSWASEDEIGEEEWVDILSKEP